MAQKTNHRCIICGKMYYHCNDCDRMKTFTPWRRVACSSECYQTYLAWRMYQDGEMTAEEMNQKLDSLKQELFALRFQLAVNQLENTARLKAVKKDIARIKTVMRAAELDKQ